MANLGRPITKRPMSRRSGRLDPHTAQLLERSCSPWEPEQKIFAELNALLTP